MLFHQDQVEGLSVLIKLSFIGQMEELHIHSIAILKNMNNML